VTLTLPAGGQTTDCQASSGWLGAEIVVLENRLDEKVERLNEQSREVAIGGVRLGANSPFCLLLRGWFPRGGTTSTVRERRLTSRRSAGIVGDRQSEA
jgi:hypothetical protein